MNTTLDQIKMLNLTEDDFKLLVDGLDSLPERGLAGELMGDLFTSMLTDKADETAIAKMKSERDSRKREADRAKEIMKENTKILQGKLLMLKRYLQENKLLHDAYEVLQIPG